jgi:RHS repeat-associated protein
MGGAAGYGALNYMHARYQSPYLGRFLTVDPVESGVPGKPQSWHKYAYTRNNPLKYVDREGEDLSIVYDFAGSGLSEREQLQVALNVRSIFRNAGVRNVQSLFKGGSLKPKATKPSDRIVGVRVTDKPLKGFSGNPAYGKTSRGSNLSTVSTAGAPESEEAKINFVANVTAHEIGHSSGALPKYSNDQFTLGTPINPEGAEPGTVMEQGVPGDVLALDLREFSEEDAELLQLFLNEPLPE